MLPASPARRAALQVTRWPARRPRPGTPGRIPGAAGGPGDDGRMMQQSASPLTRSLGELRWQQWQAGRPRSQCGRLVQPQDLELCITDSRYRVMFGQQAYSFKVALSTGH